MSKKTIRKFLQLIFSNADINIHHLKMSVLIKKIVAHIDSIGVAHKSEVTQLNDVIDELTAKLLGEKMDHENTQNHLRRIELNFDILTKKVSSLETRYAILQDTNASLSPTNYALTQTIQAHLRLKNPLLKDYKNSMSVLESILIANDIQEE